MCDEEQARMTAGSEFHTEGAATLKPREAKVVWTRGTDNRLVLEERRERVRDVVAKKRRVKSVISYAILHNYVFWVTDQVIIDFLVV